MSTYTNTTDFHESTVPWQDYIARILGYAAVGITLIIGSLTGYFSKPVLIAGVLALLYPHLIYVASRPFRKRRPYNTRQVLIHGDAVLCGFMLAGIDFPLELTILFLIMINTSFIVVGSLTAWTFCIISLFIGAAISILLFGMHTPAPVPSSLFVTAALGVGLHLSITAFNSYRQARDLIRLKAKYQRQIKQSQDLSYKVSRYISPQIWESIFSGRTDVKLETQRKKLVVFFSDLVGFTSLSEQMEAESFTDVLNSYLTEMSKIALKHGGTIDKFVGDSIIIFFGDPTTNGTKQDAYACVSMAIEMREHLKVLRKQWAELGVKSPLEIRMGINTGYCTVGNFGTESRMDYTIIGKEVNLASRLESSSDVGEILISQETHALVQDKIECEAKGEVEMKGFSQSVPVFGVQDFKANIHESSAKQVLKEGFELSLNNDRIRDEDKSNIIEELEAAIKNLRSS